MRNVAFDIRSIAEFGDREPDLYWSRLPGRFVSVTNGEILETAKYEGTVQEWFELLPVQIRRYMPEVNFLVVCPDTSVIIEHSSSFRPAYYFDKHYTYMGTLGTISVYKAFSMPEGRFIAVKLIDDAVHDMKVGKIV